MQSLNRWDKDPRTFPQRGSTPDATWRSSIVKGVATKWGIHSWPVTTSGRLPPFRFLAGHKRRAAIYYECFEKPIVALANNVQKNLTSSLPVQLCFCSFLSPSKRNFASFYGKIIRYPSCILALAISDSVPSNLINSWKETYFSCLPTL